MVCQADALQMPGFGIVQKFLYSEASVRVQSMAVKLTGVPFFHFYASPSIFILQVQISVTTA